MASTDVDKLFLYIQESNLDGLTQYLKDGGSVHIKKRGGATLLHEASKSDKRIKICILLLSYNADPNAEDENGRTPMHYNATHAHAHGTEAVVCKKLMVKGGDPCKPDKDKNTPLHDAARNGRNDIFKAQMDFKGNIDPNLQNKQGRTPLHGAAKNGHHTICSWLLGAGADPNLRDRAGNTPLHLACMGVIDGNIPKCLKMLVEKGANLVLKNKENQTPLDILPTNNPRNAWYAWEDYVQQAHQRSLYSEQLRETVPIDIVKLFICGDCCAGKTTLKKSLVRDRKRSGSSSLPLALSALVHVRGGAHQETEDSPSKATVGIDIEKHLIPFAGNCCIWDCAGHIEYHVTHGMFLGVRNAIFLVPYDLTHSHEEQTNEINYWLSFIKCAHDSPDTKPKVVLVGTHLDVLKESAADVINWADQNLENAKRTFRNYLDILDKSISLDARDGDSPEIANLRMELGQKANEIKTSTNVPKLISQITRKDRLEVWRKDNKVLPVKSFVRKIQQDIVPHQPIDDIELATTYMHDMGEIYEAKFAVDDQKPAEFKVVLDTRWLSKDIIAPALARDDVNYRDADIRCLPSKVYYSREELVEHFKDVDSGDEAIRFLQHLRLLFRIHKSDRGTATGEKFMVPARLDDKEAGLLGSKWTEEKGPFPENYGRCIKCKGVADMIVPSVFPYLQHYILEKICEGKENRYKISSSFLRFVTADGIQGIVQLTKDKKAIIVAVRGEQTRKPESDRHGCHRTLQDVLAQINTILLQYSPGTEVDTYFLSNQSLQEQVNLEDAYLYGLQDLMKAEEPPDDTKVSTSAEKPATVGRVFRHTKSEDVTDILIQGYDQRCIKQYGMECRVEWLPEEMTRYLRFLDIEDKMCEDYRSIANMLGTSRTELELILKDLPAGESVTLVLLNEWRKKKCRPCVTIGMLHTLLLFIGLVDDKRAEVLKQLQKVLHDNGHPGPFRYHSTAVDLNLSIEERSRKVALKKHWKRLTEDVMATNLVDRLDDLIPSEIREQIMSSDTRLKHAAELLMESLLRCKGTGWFDELMQALKDNNYNVLATLLMMERDIELNASRRYMYDYNHLKSSDLKSNELIHRGHSSVVHRVSFYHGQFKGYTQAAGKSTLRSLSKDELKIMRKLDHPNIIRFLGYIEKDFASMIVTELGDESLRDHLMKHETKPEPNLQMKWVKEVTSAVRYLHGGVAGIISKDVLPIVHGGIKTTKCLLFKDVLKLSDSGVYKQNTEHRDRRVIDAFIAPEVQDQNIDFTPACDIYALGVLFWEIYTQEIPEARSDILGQTIGDGRRFPLEIRDIMTLCWMRDYKERPKIGDIIAKLFQ
ncbi:uncharacterized protein [Amphiura filiformis]|uniref:uncharacterized protein n=1 Tax=Amphiura filiformis TaxID=82378 RepID=UPI003B224C0B